MYDGVPSIRLEGDEKRALSLIPEGQLLLAKAQEFAKRADVPTFSMSRRVSDDEYIYVLVAGKQNIIQISSGVKYPDLVHEEPEAPRYPAIPNFLSGLVFNGTIETREETREDGSKVSYRVIRQWAPTPNCAKIQDISLGRQPSKRLAVLPHNSMSDWNNSALFSPLVFSQYEAPRTSMWSGTMKKVVQIVFGLGNMDEDTLIDPEEPENITEYMDDVQHRGVQVQYDYKFMRTHGIYRGSDNTLWLVEISATKGVVAMPLPIFPGSNEPEFFLDAEDRGDTAMVTALEELGCLPTGEGFPVGEAFKEGLASGDILQLMSPADIRLFYNLSAYSSACGWAFNERGNEAHNVGYTWPGGEGFQKGYWYQININIGSVNKNRRPGEPIASGSANLRLQQEGYLYSPPGKYSFIPVKYYEPLLPGLMSHSASPMGPRIGSINCDTVVFVAFVNGDLKIARFFRPGPSEIHKTSYDERIGEDCLLDGSWSWGSTTGSRSLPLMPYTNDFDPRAVMEEHVSVGTLTSKSLGYDPPGFGDFIDAPEFCAVTRNKVWEQTYVLEERGGESRSACFVVPGYSREAYYYFEGHWYAGGRRGQTYTDFVRIVDIYSYLGWRKWPRIASIAMPPHCSKGACGGKHTERRIICELYTPDTCADFADSGPWASQCQDIVSLCSANPPIRIGRSEIWDKGSDFEGKWNFVSDRLGGPAFGPTTADQHDYAMAISPDPETGLIQAIFAEHSAIGEDCVIYTKGFGDERVVRGYTPVQLAKNDGMPLFIGVNQP